MAKEVIKVGGKDVEVYRAANGELYHVTTFPPEFFDVDESAIPPGKGEEKSK